jgi:ABC-type multidrug transport system ATPase subunit/pSer/pThr/pTyr-binding forkhead associated (FHA) protein
MNICPFCNSTNKPGSKFCNRCGKPLPVSQPTPTAICPQCHLPIGQTSRFCPNCGHSMILPPPPVAGAPGTQLIKQSEMALVIRFPGGGEQRHPLSPGQTTRLGRNPGNEIRINFPGVSGQHLTMELVNDILTVTDLDSTNGTEINGQKIRPNTPMPLRPGDIMRIRDGLGNSIGMSLDTGAPVSLRTRSLGMLNLAQVTNIRIGRDPSNDLPLNHPTVSSQHARLERRGNVLYIQDLGSTNGTFVNGRRITQMVLNAGDVVQIGPFKLVWDAQQQQLAQAVGLGHRLDALNLGLEVGGGKMILNKINMCILPGEFVSLVGGSGAGKSTLLKALNGFSRANHGQMLLDGEEFYTRLDLYRSQMGYVPQDDIIHMDLPVDMALSYAARLRLPGHGSGEIEKRVQEALNQVDMIEHRHKRVRVLSGGQRKRVSIAAELLAKPTMFFLDEPTSGLDPGLEKQMMQDLNRLADTGTTVVLVTHATANIEECDHVAFLDKGLLAYYGPPREALKFFDVRDFADIYRRLSSVIDPARGKAPPPELQPYYQQATSQKGVGAVPAGRLWAAHYRHSPQHKQFVSDRQLQLGTGQVRQPVSQAGSPRRSKDSLIRQTWILARRHFDLIRNNWMMLVILLALMPLIGMLFMAVSEKYDLTGWPISEYQVENVLKSQLLCSEDDYNEVYKDLENVASTGFPPCVARVLQTEIVPTMEGGEERVDRIKPQYINDYEVGESTSYIPSAAGDTLVSMVSLAITQGGTFAAAYEIVKEKAVFKRERAVNLRVGSYVLSKVLVLSMFGVVQVVSVVMLLSLKLNLNLDSVFGLPDGPWELMITLFLALLASIMFGLFISASVSNQDIVIYIILAQLFAQIILSGTMFPMENNPIMRATVANWAMDSMGSVVDMKRLNTEGVGCGVEELNPGPDGEVWKVVGCNAVDERDLGLDYEHTEDHVLITWVGLLAHAMIWGTLTFVVMYRKKGD